MMNTGSFYTIFIVVSVIAAAVFVTVITTALVRWNKNNRSPVLSVNAHVAGKRSEVTHQRHPIAGDVSGGHGYHTFTSKRYFITFRTDGGSSVELEVDDAAYETLTEGTVGRLTYQGTRYLGFESD